MTDTEKIALIGRMICDFWEYHDEQKINAGAEVFVTAINSVVVFTPPKGE